MLNIRNIITDRFNNNRSPTFMMLYEWEDVLARELKVGFKPMTATTQVPDTSYGKRDVISTFFYLLLFSPAISKKLLPK